MFLGIVFSWFSIYIWAYKLSSFFIRTIGLDMTKINRKVEYALMALKFMLERVPGELSSVKQICESTGASYDAAARVMQIMTNKGLLKSVQGAHGGYQIITDLKKVSFYDLTKMIEGPLAVVRCVGSDEPCEIANSCNIQSPLTLFNSKLVEFYKKLSLIEILSPVPTSQKIFDEKNIDLKSMAEVWS